jgi:hypothetical protein
MSKAGSKPVPILGFIAKSFTWVGGRDKIGKKHDE